MIGPLVDARVEAVAGMPVVDTRVPLYTTTWALSGTVVFVGRPAVHTDFQVAIQNRVPATVVNAYMVAAGTAWQTLLGTTRLSASPGYLAVTASVQPGTLALGRGATASQYWAGPFRVVTYDHELTVPQIGEVARRLATTI